MRVGVKVGAPITPVSWATTLAMASRAEELDFDSIWVEDHHLEPNGGPLDAWSAMAALSARTDRVSVGCIVASLNFFQSPVVLAHKIATVNEISGGRLIAGIGVGDSEEASWLGMGTDKPTGRFIEMFDLVSRLLAGERFDHAGEHFNLDDVFLPQAHPVDWVKGMPSGETLTPIEVEFMVGSKSPRVQGATFPYVSGWTTHWSDPDFNNDPALFPTLASRVDQALERAGRNPEEVWKAAEVWVQAPGALGLPVPVPESLRSAPGHPDQLAAYLARCAASGIDHLVVLLDPQTVEAVEVLAHARDLWHNG